MVRRITTLLLKALILFIAYVVLRIDLLLIDTSLPRFIFEKHPFSMSWALVVVIGAVFSLLSHSRGPIFWALFCPAFSAIFFVYPTYATTFIACFLLIAAISFVYRNKVTEPFLVLLPIIVGGWLFLHFLYAAYFVAWAYYITGKETLGGAIVQGLSILPDQASQIAIVVPIFAMYLLGKQSYVKLHSVYSSLRPNKRLERDRPSMGAPSS